MGVKILSSGGTAAHLREELEGRVLELQEQLFEIRGTSEVLNRELKARHMQLSEEQLRIARLRGDLSALRGQYESSRREAEVQNDIEGQLVSAQQELTDGDVEIGLLQHREHLLAVDIQH